MCVGVITAYRWYNDGMNDNPLETVTRQQVIELAQAMPVEKLARWYEYGLFIASRPLVVPVEEKVEHEEAQLLDEIAAWETASDEDWLKFENTLSEGD